MEGGKAHKTISEVQGKDTSEVVISEMKDLSQTVKELRLDVFNKELTFKAGQFVDFHVPGLTSVTGFSMCSSPQQLAREGTMILAVKDSDHPTSHWVHTQCQVDSKVKVRVNGDFFLELEPSSGKPMHIILIAGGVGINPIISMLLYATKMAEEHQSCKANVITLLYSARTLQDLVFQDILNEAASKHLDMIKIHYFLTQQSLPANLSQDKSSNVTFHAGRIGQDVISSVLNSHADHVTNRECYVCGPSPMIETIETYLDKAGLPQQRIHYEKWW